MQHLHCTVPLMCGRRGVIEMELTYEMMQAHIKKFFDILPSITPENKHLLAEFHIPDAVYSYPDRQTEADHVAAHYEVYRAHVFYEPWPLYMMFDERKKIIDCVIREEARHPVTGELVKDAFDKYIKGGGGIVFAHAVFELTLIGDAVKIKNTFLNVIDPNGAPWQNWRDLAKH